MFRLSHEFYARFFKVVDDATAPSAEADSRVLGAFAAALGPGRARKFWDNLAPDRPLLFWMRVEVEDFNKASERALPLESNQLLAFARGANAVTARRRTTDAVEIVSKSCKFADLWRSPGVLVPSCLFEHEGARDAEAFDEFASLAVELLESLEWCRWVLTACPSTLDEGGKDSLRQALPALGDGSGGQLELHRAQLLALLGQPSGADRAGLATATLRACFEALDFDGRYLKGGAAVSILRWLLVAAGHEDPVALLEVLSRLEINANLNYGDPKLREGAELPGMRPAIRWNAEAVLGAVFRYVEANTDPASLHAKLLAYGRQSIRDAPCLDLDALGTPVGRLRFRRQRAADFFHDKAATDRDGEWLSPALLGGLHEALFDVDPAVRLSVARTLGLLRHPSSRAPLEELRGLETQSADVRRASTEAIAVLDGEAPEATAFIGPKRGYFW